jgi:hypothetical protein
VPRTRGLINDRRDKAPAPQICGVITKLKNIYVLESIQIIFFTFFCRRSRVWHALGPCNSQAFYFGDHAHYNIGSLINNLFMFVLGVVAQQHGWLEQSLRDQLDISVVVLRVLVVLEGRCNVLVSATPRRFTIVRLCGCHDFWIVLC